MAASPQSPLGARCSRTGARVPHPSHWETLLPLVERS